MISDKAYVHPEARLGENVIVEPFAYVGPNVEIGEGTWLGPNATVLEGARIGKNCKIFPSAVISAIPQDLKFKGEESLAIIGDNTIIRECVTVNRGTVAAHKTVVGNNSLLMAYVHVAHDCVIGNNCILVNGVGLAGEVVVDDFAIISGSTIIHQFVHIGGHVIIGGGSKVRKDVPPFIKADRDPLSFMGLNVVGLTRRNFDKDIMDNIREIYRLIYQNGLNTSQALDEIEKTVPESKERAYILSFIRDSKRGIIRG